MATAAVNEFNNRSLSTSPRRRLLGWAGAGGMALVGALAGTFGNASVSRADAQNSPCCHLVKSNVCGGSYCNRTCPSGYTKRYWWCMAGGYSVGCGECVRGGDGTCWGDDIACSWWWYTSNCGDD
jgi:hypothetical protein